MKMLTVLLLVAVFSCGELPTDPAPTQDMICVQHGSRTLSDTSVARLGDGYDSLTVEVTTCVRAVPITLP